MHTHNTHEDSWACTETDTQRHKTYEHTNRHTQRHADTHIDEDRYTLTHKDKQSQTHEHRNRYTLRYKHRHRNTETDIHKDTQTHTQRSHRYRHSDIHTDTHGNTCRHIQMETTLPLCPHHPLFSLSFPPLQLHWLLQCCLDKSDALPQSENALPETVHRANSLISSGLYPKVIFTGKASLAT